MSDLIGQSLGRYHILEQLGEGGMATVYKAYDTQLDRNVAVKVLLPMRQKSEKFLKRFEREARALAKLSHPNIVGVIDYGKYEELPYLVMEYVPGGTLKQKLTGKPMPWKEVAQILAPIACALDYAHQQGIIHRDVKPSNILIAESGEPMLSDFGIAKILEADETLDLTGTGVGIGTPEYMSPEQAQGQPVDARSDVYSLGVVFYEMVAGRKPYQADTPYAVVIKHVNEPLPRPKEFIRELPEAVERMLFKALAKKPEDRFQDMASFAIVLEKLTRGSKISASEIKRRTTIRIQHLLILIILLATFVMLAAGLGLVFSKTLVYSGTHSVGLLQQFTSTTPVSSISSEDATVLTVSISPSATPTTNAPGKTATVYAQSTILSYNSTATALRNYALSNGLTSTAQYWPTATAIANYNSIVDEHNPAHRRSEPRSALLPSKA